MGLPRLLAGAAKEDLHNRASSLSPFDHCHRCLLGKFLFFGCRFLPVSLLQVWLCYKRQLHCLPEINDDEPVQGRAGQITVIPSEPFCRSLLYSTFSIGME